jgi:hypothetical protein
VRLAILLVDQNWTTPTQKGCHIAWQNGPVSLWRSLHTLDAVKDHIKSDYVKVVGMGVVGKADFNVECHISVIACWKLRKNTYERMIASAISNEKLQNDKTFPVEILYGRLRGSR